MVWVRRVVLLNGIPVTKGRPAKDSRKSRTCVYIPLKESYGNHTKATPEAEYDPSRNDSQRKQFKRTSLKNLVVINPGTQTAPAVTADPAPATESVAVNAPSAETETPVQAPTPAVEAPVESLATA